MKNIQSKLKKQITSRKKKNKLIWPIIIFLVTFFFVVIALVIAFFTRQKNDILQAKNLFVMRAEKTDLLNPLYSKVEIHNFWEKNFQTLMVDKLLAGKYAISEINERISLLTESILKRYQKKICVDLSERYLTAVDQGRYAVCASQVTKDGVPEVIISVPALMSVVAEIKITNPKDWQKRIEITLIIGYIHELDHLAFVKNLPDKKSVSVKGLIGEEIDVWPQTCEKTIRVLAEKYNCPVSESDLAYFKQWIACGQNKESPLWNEFFWYSHANFYQKDLED